MELISLELNEEIKDFCLEDEEDERKEYVIKKVEALQAKGAFINKGSKIHECDKISDD